MSRSHSNSLTGLRVLVTRPDPDCHTLCHSIRAVGGEAIPFPCLCFQEIPPTQLQQNFIKQLAQYQGIIWTSPRSVQYSLPHIKTYWPQVPSINGYAVGASTVTALDHWNINGQAPEHENNSETLWQMISLQLASKANPRQQKWLLITGLNGREYLPSQFKKYNVYLDQWCCYQRLQPQHSQQKIKQALAEFNPEIIVITSVTTLNHLLDYAKRIKYAVTKIPLVVVSQRIAKQAKSMGFNTVFIGLNPKIETILKLLNHFILNKK